MSKDNLTLKEIKSQDPFEEFLFHAADYIYRRKTTFTYIVIALLCVLVAIFGGFFWKKHSDKLQSEAFYEIEKMITSPEKVSNEQILTSLDSFYKKYGATRQGVLAKFYTGQFYAEDKQYDQAIKELEESIELFEKSSPFRVLAIIYLANVYRDMKQPQKAIDLLEGINVDLLEDARMFELAEVYLSLDDKKKGGDILKTLVSDFPNSGYKQRANDLIKKIQ